LNNLTTDISDDFRSAPAGAEEIGTLPICFSHLRWDFVYQRPQHLLSRATALYRVLFIEEPVHGCYPAPFMRTEDKSGVTVCVPHLPQGLSPDESHLTQEDLLRAFLKGYRAARRIAWYYTPQALEFSRFLHTDVVVFDNMDELSAFHGASPHLAALEAELLDLADIVFTGGASLYEAKKGRHDNGRTAHPCS
jgi:hypothetical protein